MKNLIPEDRLPKLDPTGYQRRYKPRRFKLSVRHIDFIDLIFRGISTRDAYLQAGFKGNRNSAPYEMFAWTHDRLTGLARGSGLAPQLREWLKKPLPGPRHQYPQLWKPRTRIQYYRALVKALSIADPDGSRAVNAHINALIDRVLFENPILALEPRRYIPAHIYNRQTPRQG